MNSVISNLPPQRSKDIFRILEDYNKPGFLVYRLNNYRAYFNFHFTLWYRKLLWAELVALKFIVKAPNHNVNIFGNRLYK